MAYSIKVKKGDLWYNIDIKTDTTIAINYEEGSIAEMSIKVNGSNEIELPITANNERIFSYIANGYTPTGPAYKAYPCYVFDDGIPVLQGECKLYVLAATRTAYKVAIVGSGCKFYDNLAAVKLTDEENEKLLGTWRIGFDSLPYICFGAGKTKDSINRYGRKFYSQGYLSLRSMAETLTALGGATQNLRLSTWDGLYALPKGRTPIPWYRGATYLSTTLPNWDCFAALTFRKSDLEEIEYGQDTRKVAKWCWGELQSSDYIGVHIRAIIRNASISDPADWSCDIRARYATGPTYNEMVQAVTIAESENEGPGYNYGDVGFVQDGEDLVFDACFYNGKVFYCGAQPAVSSIPVRSVSSSSLIIIETSAAIDDVIVEILDAGSPSSESVQWGAECSIANNLGWETGLDAYKVLYQIAGYISVVKDGYITGYTMQDVKDQKSLARDWSEYVVEETSSYHASMAKKNRVILQPNSVYSDRQTEISISINDDYLEETKDYISIAVESEENSTTCSYWVEEKDDEGIVSYKANHPGKPYIWSQTNRSFLRKLDLALAYNAMVDIFANGYRELEVTLILPVTEILTFDHRIPVYIRQFGRYFYVQKISNYQSGKTCTATIIGL